MTDIPAWNDPNVSPEERAAAFKAAWNDPESTPAQRYHKFREALKGADQETKERLLAELVQAEPDPE